MEKEKKIPVLLAYKDDGFYKVWCPFCRLYHAHGMASVGHRSAHCSEMGNYDSPFNETGYIIRPVKNMEENIVPL